MGEIIVSVLKWIVLVPFVLATVITLGSMFILAIGGVGVILNGTVLNDLFILVQMWLPFNLNVIGAWITTIVVLYVSYRMSVAAMLFMNRFIKG